MIKKTLLFIAILGTPSAIHTAQYHADSGYGLDFPYDRPPDQRPSEDVKEITADEMMELAEKEIREKQREEELKLKKRLQRQKEKQREIERQKK
jgi:hypothetical protein